jgi:hypothetical protein
MSQEKLGILPFISESFKYADLLDPEKLVKWCNFFVDKHGDDMCYCSVTGVLPYRVEGETEELIKLRRIANILIDNLWNTYGAFAYLCDRKENDLYKQGKHTEENVFDERYKLMRQYLSGMKDIKDEFAS